MSKFIVRGGVPLRGTVTVSGSKNAALKIIPATLLTKEPVLLKNMPDIKDVQVMLEIMESIGSRVKYLDSHTIRIQNDRITTSYITSELAKNVRASLMFLGPLLARFRKVSVPYPGGDVIGKRPVRTHLVTLEKLGAVAAPLKDRIVIKAKGKELIGKRIILPELSVTATENLVMAAVLAKGTTEIRMAAAEPHVEDLCRMLLSMGAKITGIGSHNLTVTGVAKLHGTTYTVTSDYLEAGTLILAGVITRGKITVKNVFPDQLDMFFSKLDEIGVNYQIQDHTVTIRPTKTFRVPTRLESRTYPGFPSDLQAPFAVLLSQCNGVTKIFETMYEGRLNYLFELEKMGAHVEILSPHQAIIVGPCKLKGLSVSSLDVRAGAAMVLAGLIAKGTTEVSHVVYIDRGYENLEGKLRSLGAQIERKG